jgi:hypothetical protein
MRLLTETPTHHPKNPVKSENFNHPTQGTRCNPENEKMLAAGSTKSRSVSDANGGDRPAVTGLSHPPPLSQTQTPQ